MLNMWSFLFPQQWDLFMCYRSSEREGEHVCFHLSHERSLLYSTRMRMHWMMRLGYNSPLLIDKDSNLKLELVQNIIAYVRVNN